MSQMVIRESDNLEETSSENELSDWQRDDMVYVKRMMRSPNELSKRLLNLYKVRQAHNAGVNLGYQNYLEDELVNEEQQSSSFSSMMKEDSSLEVSDKNMIL